MDSLTVPAAIALVVGVIGLVLCTATMSQVLPDATRSWSRRRRQGAAAAPSGRRVVTGPPASERIGTRRRAGRQPALRPDVLRRERERLSLEESRRVVEEMADTDPERLASVVGELLAQDQQGAGRREGHT